MFSSGRPLPPVAKLTPPSPPSGQLRLFDITELGNEVRGACLMAAVVPGEFLELVRPLEIDVINEWGGRASEIVTENPGATIRAVARLGDRYFVYLKGGGAQQPICIDQKLTDQQMKLAHLYLTGQGDVPSFQISQGNLPWAFLLPCGTTLGQQLSIGLPHDATEARVLEVEHQRDRRGHTIWVKVEGGGGASGSSIVWIEVDPKASGAEAILVQYSSGTRQFRSLTPWQFEARKYWQKVLEENGSTDSPFVIKGFRNGMLPKNFFLPNRTTSGLQLTIGLPIDTTEAQIMAAKYENDSRTIRAKVEGNGPESGRSIAWIEIDPKVSGAHAIRVQYAVGKHKFRGLSDSQYELLQHWKLVETFGESDAQLVIHPISGGQLPRTFILPGGATLGVQLNIGLPNDTTEAKIVAAKFDYDAQTFWAKVEGVHGENKKSVVWIEIDPKGSGADAIRVQYRTKVNASRSFSQSQYETSMFWKGLEKRGASESVVKIVPMCRGMLPKSFLLPGSATLVREKRIGLPADTTHATIIFGTKLSENQYLVKIRAEDGQQAGKVVTCRVGPEGVTPIEPKKLDALKGQALDRLLTAILELRNLGPERILHDLGLLTGERVIPNAITADTAFHAKWGERVVDSFEYLCKNTRVALLRGRSLKFLLATGTHREALRGVVKVLPSSDTTSLTCDLLQSEFSDLEVDGIPIRVHLAQIQAHAEAGDQEWFRTYLCNTGREQGEEGPGGLGEPSRRIGWREYLDSLSPPEISDAIARHRCCHSEYYEDRYHLEFARALSYLVSEQKFSVDCAAGYYPELRECPDAWKTLDRVIQKLPTEEGTQKEEQAETGESSELDAPAKTLNLERRFSLAPFLVGSATPSGSQSGSKIGKTEEGRIEGARRKISDTADLFALLEGDAFLDFIPAERAEVRRLAIQQLLNRLVSSRGTVMSAEVAMPSAWDDYKDSPLRDAERSFAILQAGLDELSTLSPGMCLDIGTESRSNCVPIGEIVGKLGLLRGDAE